MPSRSIRYAKTVDGFHIAYEVVGDGPFDLVYVPGWFSNLEYVWEMPDLGDFLRELATFSRLIVFDRRGFGLSDRPFTTEALSHEVGMDDIRAVMDAAGSERAVLFGWEDGGCQSLLYAASYPERTWALILFGIWVKYSASPDYPWGWTPEGTEQFWESLANKWGTEDFWRELTGFSSAIASDPERVQAWARYSRLSASPGSAVALERRDFETDVRAVLPSIQVPTLIMHRVGDTAERFEQARYIGERITGAEVVELPGTEHAPFMGDTDAVVNRVQAFVGAIREEEAEFDRVLATVLFTDLVGVETINNKVGGAAVNIGARIAAIAGPGEVLVSSTVKDLTAGSGLAFEDAGEHDLKGIPGPWHIFRVASPAPA